ncbi:TPA: hypothetical protein QCI36_002068 [Enterobacter ludwigii]|nr:hypothetical protein [Enterobacter ludwigii]MBB2846805.1 hypothetical protein [Enterobacter ludwigii]HDR2527067.1 hypothetical protein [Enterobacter ludwigii]
MVLDQTDNRYLNGIGSDLDRMRYLMDNAAAAQQSLGLLFGVSLTEDQIAALDHSLLWWEKATVNGETVLESLSSEYFGSKGQAATEAIQNKLSEKNNVYYEDKIIPIAGSCLDRWHFCHAFVRPFADSLCYLFFHRAI